MANQKITDETVIQLIDQSEDIRDKSIFLYQENAKNLIEQHLEQLLGQGIAAKVLIPNYGWQIGKLKITLEFTPDEPKNTRY